MFDKIRCTRPLLGWAGGLGLMLWLGMTPALAQRKRDKEKTDITTAKPGSASTTTVRMEEETMFAEGMRYVMTDEPSKAIVQFGKVLQKNPANAAAQYATANALSKTGKTADAVSYAAKAHALDKENKFYSLLLAELYVKQKRYGEAEELYESLVKKGAENAEYGVELAAIYLFDEKPEKALEAYNKVERELGLNEEITRQKQRIYLKQNKLDKAIEEAEKLVASEPGDPDYLLEGAELLIANDRPDQAIAWIDRALKLTADLPQAHVLLADIYRKKGDMDRVTKELNQVFSSPNLEAGLKARILSSYVGLTGENPAAQQDALTMAQNLVKTAPNDPKTQVMVADLLLQQGKKVEARDAYAKAARLDGSIYEVWGALLQLDGELNQVDSLLTHSQQALEVFPTQGLFWYSNGSANLYKRNYQQAIDALEESQKLMAASPNNELKTGIGAQLGDAYNGLGDHVKSDEAYEAVLKVDPLNDHVLNNYSYFLSLRKANLPRALQLGQKLVERNPTNATYLDTYAWVLYVSKDYPKAKQYLEKALANPAGVSGTIIEHYGDVLYQLGQPQKAVEQWKLAKTKGGAGPSLDKKIATGKIYE
ncbi:tetratricopeptide repeat protein [Spirosoma utsteinense]|uniref:Tetratricopeptide (TPR) repeat protein n=1 Tax=Spirosoma utsteinense TaxID=2585773 RepID=A0ABR6W7E1_9BACT|nr:tetratricopeptide repeat protein [Spirosoma utsteinense]MBC3784935.1 tetratricopeptide (TPR) repeat protein [Spirosoma utsteinense]MBC3792496.1 tetratricopeptide (TPR) repeat protein [Spirosoma utsteinense]